MKDVVGFEGLYAVTSCGRVWSYRSKKFMKLRVNKKGYVNVNFKVNGQQSSHSVHRLVALAYLPNPDNLPEVNHKDENKQNNAVTNLEWCSRIYNVNYGDSKEKRVSTQQKMHPNSKPVRCIETGVVYNSAQQAKRDTGISNSSISQACRGIFETAGGLHWEFV